MLKVNQRVLTFSFKYRFSHYRIYIETKKKGYELRMEDLYINTYCRKESCRSIFRQFQDSSLEFTFIYYLLFHRIIFLLHINACIKHILF